jgi:hypothetical protein
MDQEPEKTHPHRKRRHPLEADADLLREQFARAAPVPGETADAYRIANYQDGIVGATPECKVLKPHWDSGLKWPDPNNRQPGDWRWDNGVSGGIDWDGIFHRDLARYSASGPLFWASYLKPGTQAGMKKGFWINFGSGWSHLHNDDPARILTGASQRIFYDDAAGEWKMVIEATMFVTFEVVNVWTGTKQGGSDPCGQYNRISGLDPLAALTVEAC